MIKEINVTEKHIKLKDHIRYRDGWKTVCVSSCLSFIGIKHTKYKYTSTDKDLEIYEKVIKNNNKKLRKTHKNFNVVPEITTRTELQKSMKKSNFTRDDYFLVLCTQKHENHLIILNGKGETVIDTSPRSRWKIIYIKKVN